MYKMLDVRRGTTKRTDRILMDLKPFLRAGLFGLMLSLSYICVRADRTFEWKGDDPRFSGWFSISETDFQNRSFQAITRARYEFRDTLIPAASVILEDPLGFYGGNIYGRLTMDGHRLRHDSDPMNPGASFLVAVWQHPGIQVGMYGHNQGEPEEFFTYANYNLEFLAESPGNMVISA